MNYYELLGVDSRASSEDIKKAFRQRAKELHPDSNPDASKQAFAEVAEAYEVLRDTSRRATYDAARSASGPGFAGFRQPGINEDAFEEAFKRWWEKAGADWQRQAAKEQQYKSSAEYAAEQAAAWELEKQEAKARKARMERVYERTKQARAARQAQTLRTIWQTHGSVTWVDLAVAATATAAAAGIFSMWRPLVQDDRQATTEADAEPA